MGEDGPAFEQYLDVITRQAGDIRRMVDEFAQFARMPEPVTSNEDLAAILRDAVLLQREGRTDISYGTELPDNPATVNCDPGLIGQCLTNLLLNAADAIDGRHEIDGEAPPGRVRVALSNGKRFYRVKITDNGIGLPKADRDRLTDPYVTNRKKGTGLGLAIVKKIVEQHGGELVLGDVPKLPEYAGLDGAQVTLRLPKLAARPGKSGAEHRAKTIEDIGLRMTKEGGRLDG
jgi:two-component system, NtrC family, nitrogen regulation sensor histidine kinase NtrY